MANPPGLLSFIENIDQVNNAAITANWPANPASDNVIYYEIRSWRTAGDDSGTATGVSATSLTDTGKSWVASQLGGSYAVMGGAWAQITDNTATVLTLGGWTDFNGNAVATPATGAYQIIHFFNQHVFDTQVKIAGLLQGVGYSLALRAINNIGQASPWSTVRSITTVTDSVAPGWPGGAALIATTAVRGVQLSWTPVTAPDTKGYVLQVANDSGFTTGVQTLLNGDLVTFAKWEAPGGTSIGTTYYFRVAAIDRSGNQNGWLTASATVGGIQNSDIVPGAISAADLALSIGGGNILTNSSFEDSAGLTVGGYTMSQGGTGGAMVIDSAQVFDGSSAVKLTCGTGYTFLNASGVTLVAGQKYTVSGWFYASQATSVRLVARPNAGNTYLPGSAVALSANTWTRLVFTFTQPATASSAAFSWGWETGDGVAGYVVWIDAVELQMGDTATAYAPKASELNTGTIQTAMLAANAVTTAKIAANAVTQAQIAANAVGTAQIAANAITSGLLASGAVTTAAIAAGAVGQSQLANGAVGTAQLIAGAVTNAILAANAVAAGNIQAGAVGTSAIASGAITAALLAAGAVTSSALAANAVTQAAIAAGAVGTAQIAANAVTSGLLAAGAVNNAALAANAVATANIQSGAITSALIAAGAVTSSALAANAVTQAAIAAGAVGNAQLAASAVQAGNLAVTVGGANLVSNSSFEDTTALGGASPYAIANMTTGYDTASAPPFGTYSFKVQRAATGDSYFLMSLPGVTGATLNGQKVTISFYAKADVASSLFAGVFLQDGHGAGAANLQPSITTSWARYSTTVTIAASTFTAADSIHLVMRPLADIATNNVYFDGVQVELGDILTAYAPRTDELLTGVVGTNNIAANAVTAAKIAAGTITAAQIAAGTITSSQIAAGTITASNIAAGTITGSLIAAATITGSLIAAATISASNLVANTITAAQIAANTITAGQIAAGTITATQIAAGTITSDRLYAGTVAANLIQTANLAAGSITAAVIAAGTITAAQIASGTITATQIAAATITGSLIAAATISGSNLIANTITASQIAANTITAAQIAAATITSAQIASGTIVAGNIAAGTITATQIASGTITAAQIAAGTITASQIAAGTITGSLIAAATIAGSNLIANTITASQIAANTITASQIAAGAITTATIAAGAITAATIAAGAVGASQVAAAAITTDKLSVGSVGQQNLVANGSFEDISGPMPVNWTIAGSTNGAASSTSTAANVKQGASALAMQVTVAGAGNNLYVDSSSFPVTAGDSLYVSGFALGSVATTGGFYLRVSFGSSTPVAGDGTYVDVASNAGLPASWTQFQGIVSVPVGATWAKVRLINFQPNVACTMYVDAIEVRKAIGGTQILNASILNAHIVDGTIQSAKIGNLAADKIIAGTLSAAVILSGSVYTASSGARAGMDSSGFKANDGSTTDYGAGAGVTFKADNAGSAFLKGSLAAAAIKGSYFYATTADSNVPVLPTIPVGNGVGSLLLDPVNGLRFWSGNGTSAVLQAQWTTAGQLTIYSGAAIYGSTVATSQSLGTAQVAGVKIDSAGLAIWSYYNLYSAQAALHFNYYDPTNGGITDVAKIYSNYNRGANPGGGTAIGGLRTDALRDIYFLAGQDNVATRAAINFSFGSAYGGVTIRGDLYVTPSPTFTPSTQNVPVVLAAGRFNGSSLVDLSGIPSGYRAIKILWNNYPAVAGGDLFVRFNGDAGLNYYWTLSEASGGAAPGGYSSGGAVTYGRVGYAAYCAAVEVTIPGYATGAPKAFTALCSRWDSAGVAGSVIDQYSCFWTSGAVVTQITFGIIGSGNLGTTGDYTVLGIP